MNTTGKILLAGLLMASLSACSNVTGSGGASGGASGTAAAGDPSSPAYFQSTVGDRILFEVDQATLTPQAQATLGAQATWLMSNSAYQATIEGHADEQGTREYNLALGARRANAAREYLISRGVPAGRLSVVSYGKERPIEVCSVESCYEKNRRAVTVVAAGLSG